jgi:hypothetical protein
MLDGQAPAQAPDFGIEITALPDTRTMSGLRQDLARWSSTALSHTAEDDHDRVTRSPGVRRMAAHD